MYNIEWQKSNEIIEYNKAIETMEERVNNIINQKQSGLIWFLEHNDVYTAGTSALEKELLSAKFPIYQTGRGGKYTYHGPGQRIVYLILDLRTLFEEPDLRKYIYFLEEIIIKTLEAFSVKAFRRQGRVGIWVYVNNLEKKIAAIGVRVRKWVTYHGIAINLNPDLNNYSGIIPCGINEYGVTSLAALGLNYTLDQFDLALERNIKEIFGI